MFRSREGFGFDFGNIRPNRRLNAALPLHKVFDEFHRLTRENAEHIVHHQNLPVAIDTRADADGRTGNGFSYLFCQFRRNTLHQHDRRPRIIMRLGIVKQRLRLAAAPLNLVSAEGKHGLRGQTDVGTDRNTAHLQKFGRFRHPHTAFEFDHMRAGSHQFGGGGKRLLLTLLICTKRQIADNHRIFCTACYTFGVITHIAQADGQRRLPPLNRHSQRIPNQQHIHAGIVHQRGKTGFVSGQHSDFLARRLHFLQCVHSNHQILLPRPFQTAFSV
ncbi:hypothetical protein NM2002004_2229 [Neisseria meningitidis 2002004]|nr:hypothetical protein NM2002004_2229 [Neisseria meningitidis 2002004]